MRVALVHDHLGQDGGAERVLLYLQQIFPQAPTFTLIYNPQRAHPRFRSCDIRTSWLQRFPFAKNHYQWYLPLMPSATESLDLREYDVVISDTSSFAKGVKLLHPQALHLCYCHTPTRYLWTESAQYVQELRYPWIVKQMIPPVLRRLRQWDYAAAQNPQVMVANSQTVKKRIQKYYNRTAAVVYPPVETQRFSISPTLGNYFLTGGRLVAYKRFDIVVRAFKRTGIPLKVFGHGPEYAALRKMAGPKTEFVGVVSDSELAELYSKCLAFINPQVEDFGITAVEAMASGRPVIAYAAGGATETVAPGISGIFFYRQEWEAVSDAVIRFDPQAYNPHQIQAHAQQFSQAQFAAAIQALIASALQ